MAQAEGGDIGRFDEVDPSAPHVLLTALTWTGREFRRGGGMSHRENRAETEELLVDCFWEEQQLASRSVSEPRRMIWPRGGWSSAGSVSRMSVAEAAGFCGSCTP